VTSFFRGNRDKDSHLRDNGARLLCRIRDVRCITPCRRDRYHMLGMENTPMSKWTEAAVITLATLQLVGGVTEVMEWFW
jgi:hypothetical protein